MLVLNQCVLRQSIGGYNPADLFQNGTYKGFWLDASDLSTLKTDAGGTTAVTADNDPVGYWADKSGVSGAAFVRYSGDSYRPTYQVEGGKGFVRFDRSANSSLLGNSTLLNFIPSLGDFTAIMVLKHTGTPSSDDKYLSIVGNGWSKGLYWNAWSSNTYMYPGISTNLVADVPDLSSAVRTVTIRHRIDNTDPASDIRADKTTGSASTWGAATTTAFPAGTPVHCHIGAHPDYGGWVSVPMDVSQVFVINRRLTGTDLTDLETDLAARAGVTI